MTRCPKCERRLAPGSGSCPDCGTPLDLGGFGAPSRDEGTPLKDPLLEAFEQDALLRSCPVCLNEFTLEARTCRHCGGIPLVKEPASSYEARLVRRPVTDLGEEVAAGPPRLPADLVRVHIADDVHEARALREELAFMGLDVHLGSDSLDPFPDPSKIGVYVRAGERTTAAYVIEGFRPPDPLDRPPEGETSRRDEVLAEARRHHDLGKYRRTLQLLEVLRGDVEGETLAVEALLRAGLRRSAVTRAREASGIHAAGSLGAGRMLALTGIVEALGDEGHAFGGGSEPEAARSTLTEAWRVAPRLVLAGKALVEVLDHLDRDRELAEAFRRLERVSPNLLVRSGPFREMWFGA